MNNHNKETLVVITNTMLYDRLHTLAMEYSISQELLVNIAVKRLIDDIDFMRELRTGIVEIE